MTTEVSPSRIDADTRTAISAGIIGGGFMGRVHAHAARVNAARLAEIAASTPARAAAYSDELGFEAAAESADELIASPDVDIVHICTPNGTHALLAAAALAAGKHVICEKPLAVAVADAEALTAQADAAGLVAAVPFVYRYHPMVREARARVARGDLGMLLSVDAGYLQDWMLLPTDDDWRATSAAGGSSRAFADIGSHLCDLLEFIAGERIVRLSARTRRIFDERGGRAVENEDIVAILVETASGAIGTLLISQMAAGRRNALTVELHGSNESLRFDQENPERLWLGGRTESRVIVRDPATAAPDSARLQPVPAGHAMGYQDAFDNFIADAYAAVRGEAPEGMPVFADGLRAARLTEAVLESAASGRWIETGE
ncbi:Gfo/Idh/MocA family protein [Microbacterium sp. ASV49]|uniref:Gfo/Idh/MocA family oxidoreductase n=1 Tax=Microbacterium candidum TaxID=3041922 RepID=A0ABT7MU46_9MICO|nr:Gfo/Idh/MocA family oxidoreductase [Microbacterium sp. ASV49]MDL9977974.1 Gfo/Idh/MocA family oxidoreductase [Microbacterium sp. ASV49]